MKSHKLKKYICLTTRISIYIYFLITLGYYLLCIQYFSVFLPDVIFWSPMIHYLILNSKWRTQNIFLSRRPEKEYIPTHINPLLIWLKGFKTSRHYSAIFRLNKTVWKQAKLLKINCQCPSTFLIVSTKIDIC